MAIRWRADNGLTLNAGLVALYFRGIRASIAKKPYIFVIFQGGGVRTPCPPSGSAHDGATIDDEVQEFGSTLIAIIIILKHERGCGAS